MNQIKPTRDSDALFSHIKAVLDEARTNISRSVNSAVVKYTLPENNKQIFALQYMTYMPHRRIIETTNSKEEIKTND